jgi:hypothetical protein
LKRCKPVDATVIEAFAAFGLLLVAVATLAYQVGKDVGETRRRR